MIYLILIANVMVEEYSVQMRKGWILKLGIEKAFDCGDWDFVEEVLQQKVSMTRGLDGFEIVFRTLNFHFSSMDLKRINKVCWTEVLVCLLQLLRAKMLFQTFLLCMFNCKIYGFLS